VTDKSPEPGPDPSLGPEPSPEFRLSDDTELPAAIRVAAIVVLLQGAALLVAVVVLVTEIARGASEDAGRAWADTAFALLGALVLGFAARGLSYLRPAFRSPLLVLEVLTLPVGYSLIQGGRWAYGVPVVLSALVVAGLLLTRPARAALDRR
jgi:hypothetical protein